MRKFILASQSPRRREILNEAGIKHTVIPSDTEEKLPDILTPEQYVMELALLKGSSVASFQKGDELVISADTVVVLDDKIMGKPQSFDEARSMLRNLSGKWHRVLTGYCVIDCKSGASCVKYEETKVKFRDIDEKEAVRYIRSGECMDKAGAYGIQGKGRLLVEKIEGDYFNVVGLPICSLAKMLKDEFGVEVL